VSPAVAVRMGKLFGDDAGVWVRMQAAYDTWNADDKRTATFKLEAHRQSLLPHARRDQDFIDLIHS
jgi:plasmid maintenance system antidote protein VapI